MDNYVLVQKENGEKIKIEIILAFRVEETKKEYIAYTINDDGKSEIAMVLISEINPETNKIRCIPESEKDIVLKYYEQTKKAILEDETV